MPIARCCVPTGNGPSTTDLTDPWLDGLHARHLSDDVIESSTGERGLRRDDDHPYD